MGKILENLNLTLLIGIFIAIALMMAPYYAPATIAIVCGPAGSSRCW